VVGLTPAMRVKYTDQKTQAVRYFDIKSILNPDERDEMLTMQAVEVLI
jgi:head-tail adaptor